MAAANGSKFTKPRETRLRFLISGSLRGFEPLRLVPRDKSVVLGLVTSKSGTLESRDSLKRRIDEASKFIQLDQLCLSPQCGFSSTEEAQWEKLRMIVDLADEVWGSR